MPRLIHADPKDSIELGDLVEMLKGGPFDPEDEECVAEWGPALKRLANNRRFLGDLIIEELKQRCAGQVGNNQYSAQVVLLHKEATFALRANFWPAEGDSALANSGRDPFFYDLPHDHNFTFVTVGYHGPGYWSDYYEYENDRVTGYPGEKVDLRFIERSRLEEGKLMLYRKHRDVHCQLPPDALSVSLNIVAVSPTSDFRDQYRFDLDRFEVAGIINHSAMETLLRLAAHVGGENGRDLVEHCAVHHPSGRTRFAALQAKASVLPDVASRIALFEDSARTGGMVGATAAGEAARLEAARAWIGASPELGG